MAETPKQLIAPASENPWMRYNLLGDSQKVPSWHYQQTTSSPQQRGEDMSSRETHGRLFSCPE